MASEGKQNNQNHNQNKGGGQVKDYVEQSDSPIELAKMHWFYKDALKICLGFFIFDAAVYKMMSIRFMYSENWPILSTFVDFTTFALVILVFAAIMTTPTRMREKSRR